MQSNLPARTDGLMLSRGLASTCIAKQSAHPGANDLSSPYLEWRLSEKHMANDRLWPEP